MEIVTLTLSPAYDVHVYCNTFLAGRENHVKLVSKSSGGKGLNISRALSEYGIKSHAVMLLGNENCADFEKSVSTENITPCLLKINGRIRENITVHTADGEETRISFDGFSANSAVLSEIEKMLSLQKGDVLTVTGSIPEGVDIPELKLYLSKLKKTGVRIVLDSRSLSLSDIEEIKPWLIKPNAEEVSQYLGRDILDVANAVSAVRELSRLGAKNVIVSLGGLGAVLAADGKIFVGKTPKIDVISTIGAGDSMIAGFIAAAKEENDAIERFRYAIAFGSAACLSAGTMPPEKNKILSLLNEIQIHEEN